MHPLTIVTLGTGDELFLTRAVEKALHSAGQVILRTERHPMADFLRAEGIVFDSLDSLYEECEDFDIFNKAAAVKLLSLCREGPVCYAVSDGAFDATVATLQRLKPREAQVTVIPGVSQSQRCLALVEGDTCGVRVYTATDFLPGRVSPGENLLLLEMHSRECAGDCKLKLMEAMPEEMNILFFTGSEKTGQLNKQEIPLYELDRQKKYDHLTAAYVPAVSMEGRSRYDMDDLVRVMEILRSPDGCPWDREQTYESLLPNLLEECWEYIQSVRDGDVEHMVDELGDVLLHVAFQAEIGRQHGDFAIGDVTTAICRKMIERHPHVFGQEQAENAAQVLEDWENRKRRQRGYDTIAQSMQGISASLSPLMRAQKVQDKAHKTGFDLAGAEQALSRVREQLFQVENSLKNGHSPGEMLGDALFAIAALCRLSGQQADLILSEATSRFISRFENMEKCIKKSGKSIEDLTLSEMDVYWNVGKRDHGTI